MNSKAKIAVCIPTAGSIKTETFASLVNMFWSTQLEWKLFTQTSSLIHENRNILVEKALKSDCTHLLFVDTDMKFESDVLDRLVEREKEIIGVVSCARKLPLAVTVKKLAEGFEIWEKEGDLMKCAGVGTGFMLIDLKVFQKLSKPYFFYEHKKNGDFDYGEDMYFCLKAREVGFNIYLDPAISVGHIGDFNYQMAV